MKVDGLWVVGRQVDIGVLVEGEDDIVGDKDSERGVDKQVEHDHQLGDVGRVLGIGG